MRLIFSPGAAKAINGDWRAGYRLDHDTGEMLVDKIAKRDEAYR